MTIPFISGAFSLWSGIRTYVIIGAVTALVAGGVAGYAGWKIGDDNYQRLIAANAEARAKAAEIAAGKQTKIDNLNLGASTAEATAQAHLASVAATIKKGVHVYVTARQDAAGCITYGFVRVLVAAGRGVEPDSLVLPTGEPDDACTALTPSAVAATVADAYGTSRQNSEQLDRLVASVRANQAVVADK